MKRQRFSGTYVSDAFPIVREHASAFYLRGGKNRAVRMIEAPSERASKKKNGVAVIHPMERELRIREVFPNGMAFDAFRVCLAPCPVVTCRAVGITEQHVRGKHEGAADGNATIHSADGSVRVPIQQGMCPRLGRRAPAKEEHGCCFWQGTMKLTGRLRQFDARIFWKMGRCHRALLFSFIC